MNELLANQALQLGKEYGLNAAKSKFYNFGPPPVQDEPDAYSSLGTPVFDQLVFYGTGQVQNGTYPPIVYYDPSIKKTITVPAMTMNIAIITVNKKIRVVKSPVSGRNGTIKQFISLDDYSVEIKGTFTSEIPDTRPVDAIRNMHLITSATCEVNVASHYLQIFGINALVFDGDQPFEMEEGNRSIQKFTLNCISETPFILKVLQQGSTSSNNAFNVPI